MKFFFTFALLRFNLNKNYFKITLKMKQIIILTFLTLLTGTFFTSCSDDDPVIEIDNPNFYEFERNAASTVSFSGQSTRIAMGEELISALKDFGQTATTLQEIYANETTNGSDANPFSNEALNSSTKSIRSKTAASRDFFSSNTTEAATIKADFESWIDAQVNEVFPNQNQLAAPGVAGQIADGSSVRYVNGKGLEYNQAVNKGLIGALLVDQMLNNYFSTSVLDEADNRTLNDAGTVADGKNYTTMEHKWDEAYGYLFEASSDSTDPIATLGEDSFLNKYLSRVNNDSDFAGIANDIFEAFKLGRAAIVAGDYTVRDQQAEIIKELVSKVIGVRAVYYLQAGKNALPGSGNDYGPAFHDLSEGFGFVYSLRFTRKPNSNDSYFSRSEVDTFISQLTEGNGFWDVSASTLDEISSDIAAKFDFTVSMAAN